MNFDINRPIDDATVKVATDCMALRGPDDSRCFVSGNIGLGHRRLSIIDLSSGKQPMTNENGKIVTVYNGEIYNFMEIRNELISRGHTFRTKCDTEVIIHGYEEWGFDCVQRFNGMFAFALWDDQKKRLWVVRDRIGIKPLYYYYNSDIFICASEIKPLLVTGIVKGILNEDVLDAYFSIGYVPGPQTIFKGVMKLMPGHYLTVDNNFKDNEYWDLNPGDIRNISIKQAKEEIEQLLIDSVQKRLMSDVPLGVFLSGGLDSSSVVALMNRVGRHSIKTFTIGYKDDCSEEVPAQRVADHFNTDHHVFHLEADDFFSSIKKLVYFAEEPIVEPAAIPLYYISKLARQRVIVLLSGEGSDEIFGGYFLYRFMQNINLLHEVIPKGLYPLLHNIGLKLPKEKYKKYIDWVKSPLKERYQGISSYLTSTLKSKYYDGTFFAKKSSYLEDCFSDYFKKVKRYDPLMQMLYVDTKTWLVDDLLLKADKMTMAASVELRVPFLDYRLVEAMSKLPSSLKISHGKDGKYLLKKIMEPYLPKEIIYRKKRGFPVPTKNWFMGNMINPLKESIKFFENKSLLNPAQIENMIQRHANCIEDHSKFLMTLLVISEWEKQFC